MQTRTLHTLRTIAETGSFIAAAQALNLTLSTVSMQIKALEQQLGTTLFDRSVRPPALTPLGRRVAAQADQVLKAQDDLVKLCTTGGVLSGIWRLGFIATASVRVLPGVLKRANRHAPQASFEFETALSEVLETRVRSGQLDAAVVTASPNPTSGLSYLPLRSEALVFAIPKIFYARPIEEIAQDLPFLQFNPGSGIGKLIETYMAREITTVRTTIVLDSVEAIMECVNEGIGFTLLTNEDVRRYGTVSISIKEPTVQPPNRSLVLAVPVNRATSPEIKALVALFQ